MRRRIVDGALRPMFWMSLLLVWVELSALRSWHTTWSSAALTEALRWSAGIGLALTFSLGLTKPSKLAQVLTVSLGVFTVSAIVDGVPKGFVTGPFGDHQLCASAILALLPFSLAVAVAASRPTWRWTGQIIALAAGACLLLTQTRSAWIGAAVGGCIFFVLWMRRTRRTQPRWPVFLIPIIAALAVGLSFLWIIHTTEFANPLGARAATLDALGKDGSWQWRLATWRGVIHMICVHPWIGWGIGHYAAAHGAFTHLDTRLLPNQRPSLSDQAHDLYLQTAADLGLTGLLLYLGALAVSVRWMLRTLFELSAHLRNGRQSKQREALLIAGLSLLGAQTVDALASPSWQFPEVSLLFWIGLGVCLAACRTALPEMEGRAFLSPRIRVRLQSCAAGFAAVLLIAQLTPLSVVSPSFANTLLNPKDTYGATLQSLTINGVTALPQYPVFPADYYYTATANYSDGTTADVTASTDFTTNSVVSVFYPGNEGSNLLTVLKGSKGATIAITATYTEGSTTVKANLNVSVPDN